MSKSDIINVATKWLLNQIKSHFILDVLILD